MNVKIVLILLAAGLALVFTIQNVSAVTVSLLFWQVSLSLALLVFLILTVGLVIGWFLHSLLAYRRDKREVAQIQADLRREGTG